MVDGFDAIKWHTYHVDGVQVSQEVFQQLWDEEKNKMGKTSQDPTLVKLLACDCGDCTHWECIMKADDTQVLKCKTCGHEFDAKIDVAPHTKLKTVEREA